MFRLSQIQRHISNGNTLLGVGPMSKECVDRVIHLANTYCKPILLIASRRQIDSEEFGGGYVNNWSTKEFASYVRSHDKKGCVLLARDHGGPWQNPLEVSSNLSLVDALDSAKRSFREDIHSGFDFIHIDTSIDIHHQPSPDETIERLLDLYNFCYKCASDLDKNLIFEIGTEEQSGDTNDIQSNQYILTKVKEGLLSLGIPDPHFMVMQTGTRVLSDRNVGVLDSLTRLPNQIPAEILIPQIVNFCNSNQIYLKEHNLDYASTELLQWHPRLGIHAANVAPEFGVVQTRCLFNLLSRFGAVSHLQFFIDQALASEKWKKWFIPEFDDDPLRKALLSFHYCLSYPDVQARLNTFVSELEQHNVCYEQEVSRALDSAINRYLISFGY